MKGGQIDTPQNKLLSKNPALSGLTLFVITVKLSTIIGLFHTSVYFAINKLTLVIFIFFSFSMHSTFQRLFLHCKFQVSISF